jgi:dienelactone hydrolase
MDGWTNFSHGSEGIKHQVWVLQGDPGRVPLLVLHELPGFTPEFIALCQRLADEGFAVYAPLYFGHTGQNSAVINPLRVIWNPNWAVRTSNYSCKELQWTESLVTQVANRHPGKRVGAIGNCLTGGFSLALVTDPHIYAAVVSQPSIPLNCSKKAAYSPGYAPGHWVQIQAAVKARGIPILAFRFANDGISPPERFETYRSALGTDLFIDRTIKSEEYGDIPVNAHAVLTGCYKETSNNASRGRYVEMVSYLRARLVAHE